MVTTCVFMTYSWLPAMMRTPNYQLLVTIIPTTTSKQRKYITITKNKDNTKPLLEEMGAQNIQQLNLKLFHDDDEKILPLVVRLLRGENDAFLRL